MKINRKLLRAIEAFALALLVWCVVGVALHMDRLESVMVTLDANGTEHLDKTLLGVGKADEAPDYRLRVRVSDRWYDLGTYSNTYIGDGLKFSTNTNYPIHEIEEFQLLDEDKLENDVIEQFPFDSLTHNGNNYNFQINKGKDLSAGFAWFFKTPIGIAILAGITLAVFLIVIGSLGGAGF